MTRAEDAEALTRVGPGTLMGDLLRQYWIPAVLGGALDAPRRIRLLGEDLLMWRDEAGEAAVIGEFCPHRGASLWLGRAERGGLRCAYHGWLFDRRGACREAPNEPDGARLAPHVRATAYPCAERAGLVWVYMGPRDPPPPLPDLEWATDTRHPAWTWQVLRSCSWLRGLEADLDSSHIAWLHGVTGPQDAPTVPGAAMPGSWRGGMALTRASGPPRIEAVDAPFGALYSARRQVDGEREYHRVHPFLFPFHAMLGGSVDGAALSFNGKAWVPVDDATCVMLEWHYRPDVGWTDSERDALRRVRDPWGSAPPTSAPWGWIRPAAGRHDDYRLDRGLHDRMRLGILSNPLQDAAVLETMDPSAAGRREHLGPADVMITRTRRRLLDAARALAERGEAPPGVDEPKLYRVRPVGAILPRGADWLEATRAQREGGGAP